MSGSQIGGVVGGAIGGVIGFAFGNPVAGLRYGYAIGSVVGGYVDPARSYGPRLEDASAQTSTVGGIIPFGYGVFTCAGNIIWADRLIEHKKTQRVGKGGGQKETTYTYTRSYAVAVCEGPIHQYLWVKENGKLVYSADPAALGAAMGWDSTAIADLVTSSNEWLQKTTLYMGTDSQMPDSTIVAVEGVGNVSPFRDLAYIVKENEDLTAVQGAVSQHEFCIRATPPEAYLTSKPYPQYFESSALTSAAVGSVTVYDLLKEVTVEAEEADESVSFRGGMLVVNIPNQLADAQDSAVSFTGGKLSVPPVVYFDDSDEEVVAFTGGSLVVAPVGNPDPDEVNETVTFMGGQLRVP